MASEGGHVDTVKSLIVKGADISVKDKDGVSECDYTLCILLKECQLRTCMLQSCNKDFSVHALLKRQWRALHNIIWFA